MGLLLWYGLDFNALRIMLTREYHDVKFSFIKRLSLCDEKARICGSDSLDTMVKRTLINSIAFLVAVST